MILVALTLPVARRRCRPGTKVRHTVVIDVDATLCTDIIVVNTPPAVDATVQLLCDPTVLPVLSLTGKG